MVVVGNPIKRVTSNKALRHFTIIKQDGTKYRTCQMTRGEFNSNIHNTLNDWNNFLKSDCYYVVK